ncbi:hypothetical protein KCU95_g756, partial [Aureobasidium melanogenum]
MTSSSSLNEVQTPEVHANALQVAKPKLSRRALKYETVFLVYKGYLKLQADAQDDNLENLTRLCLRFNWVPSIDTVNWLILEANLIDEKHRLNFAVYPFMQEFKFLMGATHGTKQPRLFVGILRFHQGQTEVWAGWPKIARDTNSTTTARTELYDSPEAMDEDGQAAPVHDLSPELRRRIKWDEPLEKLFRMSEILRREGNLSKAAQVQDAILLSVAKVVIRFPGLLRASPNPNERRGHISTDTFEFSQRPFDDREPESPDSPFLEAYRKLNYGPDPAKSVHRCHPPDSKKFKPDVKAFEIRAGNKSVPYWAPKSKIKWASESVTKNNKRKLVDFDFDDDIKVVSESDTEVDLSAWRSERHNNDNLDRPDEVF